MNHDAFWTGGDARTRDVLDGFYPEKHSNIAVFHYGRGQSHLFAYEAMVSRPARPRAG